jgi:hypothetical protein
MSEERGTYGCSPMTMGPSAVLPVSKKVRENTESTAENPADVRRQLPVLEYTATDTGNTNPSLPEALCASSFGFHDPRQMITRMRRKRHRMLEKGEQT